MCTRFAYVHDTGEGSRQRFVIGATPSDNAIVPWTAGLLSREKVSTFDRAADIKYRGRSNEKVRGTQGATDKW